MAPRDETGGSGGAASGGGGDGGSGGGGPMAHLQYFGGGSLGAAPTSASGAALAAGAGNGNGPAPGSNAVTPQMDYASNLVQPGDDMDGLGLLDDMLARRSSGFNIPQASSAFSC